MSKKGDNFPRYAASAREKESISHSVVLLHFITFLLAREAERLLLRVLRADAVARKLIRIKFCVKSEQMYPGNDIDSYYRAAVNKNKNFVSYLLYKFLN